MERKTVKLQDLPVDTFTDSQAFEYIESTHGQVVTINPEMISCAKTNESLKNIIENAELVIPDGIGVEIGLKILGYNVRRIAGIAFAHKLLEASVKNCQRVALIGSKPEVITKAVENLKAEIPGINIIYVRDGYFKDDDKVLSEIKEMQPEVILAALGSPKQEEFIYNAKKLLPNAIMIGVGGSFDVWSGCVERAPEIYQKIGLEWLYRTVKEPKRFKRIFPTLPLFVINVLKEKWGIKC
ncbi:MAG: WecB/TagA/CpsF family glycosyltransferase [Clostridiaceae bacterium]|jgi:N-acetylglucosaminyldiphosphoundecaprenol N-acetyl-beta-D-mannosaminyltransferase|nr:WecB/TagA/CpsF family glycosyltransferase [Clostridiaceae bacterium]